MQIVLPDVETRAYIDTGRPMDDDEFFDFCMQNQDVRIERAANGEIIIMPPAGTESGYRNNDISRQLGNWAISDKRGVAIDSNGGFILPNGAIRSPDGAWVEKSRFNKLTKKQKQRFSPICPDFAIELMSPADRLSTVKAKMREFNENGAALGWLIHPNRRTVFIYRPGQEPEEIKNADHVDGEGPVAGFRLELAAIWQGL